eukprot:6025007-Amphidinium_carterae.1
MSHAQRDAALLFGNQADYYMKELCMGAAAQPLSCMKSCFDLIKDCSFCCTLVYNTQGVWPVSVPRENWVVILELDCMQPQVYTLTVSAQRLTQQAEVFLSEDDVLVPAVRMAVEVMSSPTFTVSGGKSGLPIVLDLRGSRVALGRFSNTEHVLFWYLGACK